MHSGPATGSWGDPLCTVSSSAADAESQDPESTNSLESEAPRDYFLKCKLTPGLAPLLIRGPPRLLGWALAHEVFDSCPSFMQ